MDGWRLSSWFWSAIVIGAVGLALHGYVVSDVEQRSIQASAVATQFMAGSHCLLAWSVTNAHPIKSKRVTFRVGLSFADPSQNVSKEMTVQLAPRETKALSTMVEVPPWAMPQEELIDSPVHLASTGSRMMPRDPLIPRKGFVEVVRVADAL